MKTFHAPSRAPSALASLAADLQALEIQRLDAGELAASECGRELLMDARHHRVWMTQIRRNPVCRAPHDVARLRIETTSARTMRDLLQEAGASDDAAGISLEGDAFVAAPNCAGCGRATPVWRLRRRTPALRCQECGEPIHVSGFDLRPVLDFATAPRERIDAPLAELGFCEGDVVTVSGIGASPRHLELGGLERVAGGAVIVVGCGAIGSHLVAHLARMEFLRRLVIVDPDRYESANLPCQAIEEADVGRPKALVQAERVRRISPRIEASAWVAGLEDVPLGVYRGAVLAGCLDSRAARLRLSEIAWWLGAPLVDAGVEASGLLARVTVVLPQADGACGVCAWSDQDYELLEQTHPCGDIAEGAH